MVIKNPISFCPLRLLCLTALLASSIPAQQPPASRTTPLATESAKTEKAQPPLRPGSIKGRVLGDDGQPLGNIPIFAVPIGRGGGAARRQGPAAQPSQSSTDDDGNFEFPNLLPASYSISASVPGFIAPPPEEETGGGIYHLGDFVTITMVKGGVITGKVLNSVGEPLTGISVNAIRIGDVNGEPDDQSAAPGFGRGWRTDDRGVYRIYGLAPGSYIVQAGGQSGRNGFGPNSVSPFNDDVPTYYPAAARDAAVAVAVHTADEMAGIDIRYRGEKGRTVSGKVVAKGGENNVPAPTQIILTLAGTDAVVASAVQMGRAGNAGFALYGVPDGEYEITARRGGFGASDSDAIAAPRHVSVQGADVGGLQLPLTPLALLSGKVMLERKAGVPACPAPRRSFVEEILLTARRDDSITRQDVVISRLAPVRPVAPTATGDFTLRNLEAGRWRLDVQLPEEEWYVRAMTPDGKAPAGNARKPTMAAGPPPINLARNGVAFKLGEKLTNVTVMIAEGAAGIAGKVVGDQDARIPGKARVYLIPAEKDSADDVLRYAQTTTTLEGNFHLKHLAPGRYYLLARPARTGEGGESRPLAWDAAKRAALRKEAEAAATAIELQPCQRVSEYKLSLGGKPTNQ